MGGGFPSLQSLIQLMQASNNGPMNERPPVPLPGLGGGAPGISMPAAAGGGIPSGASPSGGIVSPAIVGGPPPNVGNIPATSTEKPGLPSNLGMFKPIPPRTPQPTSFSTKSARNASAIQSGIEGIRSGVMEYKQKQYQNNMQQAKAATAQVLQLKQAIANTQDPKAKEILEQQLKQLMQNPKIHKMFDKAMQDPNSPFYFGVQQAYKDAQGQAMQEAQMETFKAQIEQAKQRAEFEKQEAAERLARAKLEDEQAATVKDKRDNPQKYAKQDKPIFRSGGIDPKTKEQVIEKWNSEKQEWERTTAKDIGISPGSLPSTTRTTKDIGAGGEDVTTTTRTKGGGLASSSVPGATHSHSTDSPKADSVKNKAIASAAEEWYMHGQKPAGAIMQRKASALLKDWGVTPGQKPSGDAQRRMAAAAQLITPAEPGGDDSITSLEKYIKALPQEKKDRLGTIWSNFDFIEAKIKGTTGDRDMDRLLEKFQSVYAIGATVHGWRGYKAPEQLQKSFGDIRRSSENILDSMEDLRNQAKIAKRIGMQSMESLEGGPKGQAVGAGASGGGAAPGSGGAPASADNPLGLSVPKRP